MRRVAALSLLGLGAGLVGLALIVRCYVYPSFAQIPLDEQNMSVLRGEADVLVLPEVAARGRDALHHGVDVTQSRVLATKPASPDSAHDDTTVWKAGTVLRDSSVAGPNSVIKALSHQICVDRSTAESVRPCPESSVGRVTGLDQQGLSYRFPFNTGKHDYDVFDPFAQDSETARFDGQDQVDGVSAYRFVQDLTPTQVSLQPVPGRVLDSEEPLVSARRYYGNTRTMWVDPETGQVLKEQQARKEFLRGPTRATVTVFDGTLSSTEKSVHDQVAASARDRSTLWMTRVTAPVVLGGLGVVSLIAGGSVELRYRRGLRRCSEYGPVGTRTMPSVEGRVE